MRRQIEGHGFNMDVVESVNVHDDIKIGLPYRNKRLTIFVNRSKLHFSVTKVSRGKIAIEFSVDGTGRMGASPSS